MEPKKISFGFNKTTKKTIINAIQKPDKIELIDCLEGQSIKVIGKEEVQERGPLVIPLQNDRKITERIKNLVDICKQRDTNEDEAEAENKPVNFLNNGVVAKNETLDQRAARELIEQIKDYQAICNETKVFTLPLKPEDLPLDGAKESSLDDYNSVPIIDFGLAMLRGMGWKDEEKSKKNKKLDCPVLRPKGMGLGADKMAKPSQALIPPALDEVLEFRKNAYIRILAGKHKDAYGQIEGLDDDSGRVIIKLALGTTRLSLNEFMVQVVSKNEYAKYAKIINSTKYEEYKNRDSSQVTNDEEILTKNEKKIQNSSDIIKVEYNKDQSNYDVKVKKENLGNKVRYEDNTDSDDNNCKEKTSHKGELDGERNSRKSNYVNHSPKRSQWSGSKKKKSSHKRSSHKSHNDDRSRSRDNRYHSSRSDNEDDDKRHKKKTKKSKKPRSRSRNR